MTHTCLTCALWNRHADKHVGSCQACNLPEVSSCCPQHEDCTEGRYQFGEDRPAAKYEEKKSHGLQVCAYYATPMMGVDR